MVFVLTMDHCTKDMVAIFNLFIVIVGEIAEIGHVFWIAWHEIDWNRFGGVLHPLFKVPHTLARISILILNFFNQDWEWTPAAGVYL